MIDDFKKNFKYSENDKIAAEEIFSKNNSNLKSAKYFESVLEDLLDFCSFAEMDKLSTKPNPFDDPYVGAVLTNEKMEVLGAHRKRTGSEMHAEPFAIINALFGIRAKKGVEGCLSSINKAYSQKAWLQSNVSPIEFERLFARAGSLLVQHTNSERLHVFSTLEPCRDYETQPSCACIICALGASHVYYGSDDTNEKGKGRFVLSSGEYRGRIVRSQINPKPPIVKYNLATEKSVEVNKLFFTTDQIVKSFFSQIELGKTRIGPQYSTIKLAQNYTDVRIRNGRVVLGEKKEPILPLFSIPGQSLGIGESSSSIDDATDEQSLNEVKLSSIKSAHIEEDLALVLKHPAEEKLLDILYDRIIHKLKLPYQIITTRSKANINPDLLKLLEEDKRIIVHPNSFRKQDEQFTAHRNVLLTIIRSELRENLYVMTKNVIAKEGINSAEPYSSYFGDYRKVSTSLETAKINPSRISVYSSLKNVQKISDLLNKLSDLDLFGRKQKLNKTSVEVRVCLLPNETPNDARIEGLRASLQSSVKVRTHISTESLKTVLSAKSISELLSGMGVDPTYFSPLYLRELTGSLDWRDRRNAGKMIAEMLSREPSLTETMALKEILDICDEGLNDDNWKTLCTYLNALEDLHKTSNASLAKKINSALVSVGAALQKQLTHSERRPWLIDASWRWIAASSKYSDVNDFAKNIKGKLKSFFLQSPFLLSQTIYYISLSEKKFDELFKIFPLFATSDENLERNAIVACSTMLARQYFAKTLTLDLDVKEDVQAFVAQLGDSFKLIFDEEFNRCEKVWREKLVFIENEVEKSKKSKAFASLMYLRTLIPSLERGSDRYIADDLSATWRGDQTRNVMYTLRELSPESLVLAIEGLVSDPDVSTRWSGLSYIFGPDSSRFVASIAPNHNKAELHELRRLRLDFAKKAISFEEHYWLTREIISYYTLSRRAAQKSDKSRRRSGGYYGWGLPPISSIPNISKTRLKYISEPMNLHPEVRQTLDEFWKVGKSIALLLPPIFDPRNRPKIDGGGEINGGSPPLGLGQIAAHLSSQGHYVEIIDAHRYSIPHTDLINRLGEFDIVGISTVVSSLNTTRMIAEDLKGSKCKIVLGGHAVTLMTPEQIEQKGISYDFIVVGPGEEPLAFIANDPDDDLVEQQDNIIAFSSRKKDREKNQTPSVIRKKLFQVRTKSSQEYERRWPLLSWASREQFKHWNGDAAQYEPAFTRNKQGLEAHIVMSRGCEWDCSFCTEALIGGKHGENRRTAKDVVEEVFYISEAHKVTRLQFVDDNIFPAKPKAGDTQRKVNWSREFLNRMTEFKTHFDNGNSLSWRGLMRIEDFMDYCELIPNFVALLAGSGCNLLAFGVETGNADIRRIMKGKSTLKGAFIPDNDDIKRIVADLHEVGIFSKGYFILGGPKQSISNINETIDFSISAGFDIAYFAIYKDFKGITSGQSKSSNFALYAPSLDSLMMGKSSKASIRKVFGNHVSVDDFEEMKTTYNYLAGVGFSFSEMIKYNDYHIDDEFYPKLGVENAEKYLNLLASSYAKFYCRDGWQDVYQNLLDAGY